MTGSNCRIGKSHEIYSQLEMHLHLAEINDLKNIEADGHLYLGEYHLTEVRYTSIYTIITTLTYASLVETLKHGNGGLVYSKIMICYIYITYIHLIYNVHLNEPLCVLVLLLNLNILLHHCCIL